jgi:hypothetical protein
MDKLHRYLIRHESYITGPTGQKTKQDQQVIPRTGPPGQIKYLRVKNKLNQNE